MPIVIPPGYAQFTLRWQGVHFASGNAATVLGFGDDGAIVDTADAFAERIALSVADNLAAEYIEIQSLVGVYWQTADQSGEYPANIPGDRAGDVDIANVAFLASYSTGYKGPRARGRSYLPGFTISTDTGDNGLVVGSRVQAIKNAVDAFFSDLTDGVDGVPQVILQRDEPEQKTPPLDPPPAVVARRYNARLATQRHRLRP